MDGVLSDFDQAMLERDIINRNDFIHKPRDQWTAEEVNLSNAVEAVMRQPGFWLGIPLMRHAKELVQFCNETYLETYILTARPNVQGTDWVGTEKKTWIKHHFGDLFEERFICCLRSEKQNYATDNGIPNLLVDDMERNCIEWRRAGGTAIQWK
jgi:5'(3')-deoxyribonucleotidase